MPSFFERLLGSSPRENVLTEALGVVCTYASDFRDELASLFLGCAVRGVQVRTQALHRFGPNYKCIDLEFWHSDRAGRRELTGFVEIKCKSREHRSAGLDSTPQPQTRSYEQILAENARDFGVRVGLFSLTPRWNPLPIILDSPNRGRFIPPRNVFWDEVGLLARRLSTHSQEPRTCFLCGELAAFLEEVGLMTEQHITVQEIATAASYIAVKNKLWAALDPVSEFLRPIVKRRRELYYPAASRQEIEHNRFCVLGYLDVKTDLAVGAGFYLAPSQVPWVGAWIEVDGERYPELHRKLRKEFERCLPGGFLTGEGRDADNEWRHATDPAAWWISAKGRPLTDFLGDEAAIAKITHYLQTQLCAMLRVPDLASFLKGSLDLGSCEE